MGPADVLDHAAQAFTYGGKLGIDATKKLPEEISTIRNNEIEESFNISSIHAELKKYSEIAGFNTTLMEEGFGLLFLSMKKTRKNHVNDFVSGIADNAGFSGIKFFIVFDQDVSLKNISTLTWLTLSNIDPVRDCFIKKTEKKFFIIIDATRKNLEIDNFQNEWPSIISMNEETIRHIDKKWDSLGLGKFIPSPSLF
jgi:4-hydroxy-3-polyprenylbenzoate decarboxylase